MAPKYLRRAARVASFVTVACVSVVLTPESVGAAELGGYELTARADALHFEMFDPALPIPAEPQGDLGIGHTKSTGSYGPSTRGTASAVWPGDVVGDGFGTFAAQFGGNPNTKYPDQINGFYPGPPTSAKQDFGGGNGEFVDAGDRSTSSRVQLVGLSTSAPTTAAPSTSSGLTGLQGLIPSKSTSAAAAPTATSPVPVGGGLGALVQTGTVASDSVITYAADKATSTAHAKVSDVSILGGIIGIKAVDMTAVATSNGKTSSSSGFATISGVTIAGQDLGINSSGVKLGPTGAPIPDVTSPINALLKATGISVDVAPGTRSIDGVNATARQTGLVLTIDTKVVKTALGDPGSKLAQVLGPIFDKIPQNNSNSKLLVSTLYGVLNLGPKLVINIGDVEAKASASEAYVFTPPPFNGGTGVTLDPNPGGVTNAGSGSLGDGLGNIGAPDVSATVDGGGVAAPLGSSGDGTGVQPVAKALPPLGKIPPVYILGALVLAAGLGWIMQAYGGVFVGGAARVGAAFCSMGLDTDLPNLREGQ